MQFKDEGLKDELAHTPTMLQIMAEWFNQLSQTYFHIDPIVTRVFERVAGSSGVHEIGHGVDFRDEHNGTHLYAPEQVQFLVSSMNKRFPRSDDKLTCIHHSFCGGMFHFHLQVNLTTSKDEGEAVKL